MQVIQIVGGDGFPPTGHLCNCLAIRKDPQDNKDVAEHLGDQMVAKYEESQ